MLKFSEKNSEQKLNKQASASTGTPAVLLEMRKRIALQAGLALLVLILTIVIVFAMTAAWSTNVVQTSGLQFQAEAWGFDREITILTDPIAASPGDRGAVSLEVTNQNQDAAAIRVSVSRADMDEQIQKRLYFYVDAEKTRNSETLDRVYLNSRESYTYILAGGKTLSLPDDTQTDAPLMWHWVYDVLGYYVLGSFDGAGMTVNEYLRPIEYDYDPLTTVFALDADGMPGAVESINGISAGDFLRSISAHDGYPGRIDPAAQIAGGWYPVDVDESGYGVYAYLCTFDEIEEATRFDTALGEAAAAAVSAGTAVTQYQAQLTVSAENYQTAVITAASLADIEDALAAGLTNTIRLSGDVAIQSGCTLKIPEGQQVALDLNGYTLGCESTESALSVGEGACLSLTNGSITGAEGSTTAIYALGAEVTIRNVDISGFEQGIYVEDSAADSGADSTVRLEGCTLNTGGTGVLVCGNGSTSMGKTTVVIADCTIYSDGIAISGTDTEHWGTDITLTNSTITANPEQYTAAVYHPQKDSILTIENCILSGYTGLAIKGGTVEIVDSQVTGLGPVQSPVFSDSGFAATGDGIYIETNYGYEILLEITGTTVSSESGQSLQVYEADSETVTVRIHSGEFDQDQPEHYLAEGSVQEQGIVTGS